MRYSLQMSALDGHGLYSQILKMNLGLFLFFYIQFWLIWCFQSLWNMNNIQWRLSVSLKISNSMKDNNPSFCWIEKKWYKQRSPQLKGRMHQFLRWPDEFVWLPTPIQHQWNIMLPIPSNINESSRCPSLFGTTPLTQCQLTGPPSSILVKDINERIVSVRGYERNIEKSEKGDKSEFRIIEERMSILLMEWRKERRWWLMDTNLCIRAPVNWKMACC